jgi:hypothetical protein
MPREYWPATQVSHAVEFQDSEYIPGGHVMQETVPLGVYFPGGHPMQLENGDTL